MLKRILPAILAALILPACGHGDDDDNRVTITNTGVESAEVRIEHERDEWWGHGSEHHDDFDLDAGSQSTRIYDRTHQVKVAIYRKSDGLLIFSEEYDLNDFERHDRHVWITVNP